MLVYAIIAVAGIIIVLFALIAARPAGFRITRSTTMAAPPSAVFAQVNDFHHWEAWSPWSKLDPTVRNTFEGSPAGEGAVFKWSGNKHVGEGMMTIMESRPYELIRINLQFLKPFAANNTAEFTFTPQGDRTLVTWSMSGQNNFMAKAFSLLLNMDKMVGRQFEQGLASMKAIVESRQQ